MRFLFVSALLAMLLASTSALADATCDIAGKGFSQIGHEGNKTPEWYAEEQARLREKIGKWQTWQSRTMSATEWRGDRVSLNVKRGLVIDNSARLAKAETAMFNKAQLAYLKSKDALDRVDQADKIISALRDSPGALGTPTFRQDLQALRLTGLSGDTNFANVDDALARLTSGARALRGTAEEQAIIVAKTFDEYRPGLATLLRASENTTNPELAANAKKALEYLAPKRLIVPEFGRTLPNGLPDVAISYKDMQSLMDRFPASEIARLKQELNREVFDFALSISPTEKIFQTIERVSSKFFPGAGEELRSLLNSIDQTRVARLYYPDISRITRSTADLTSKLKLLEVMSVNRGNNHELLLTLARRVDLQDEWKLLFEAANGSMKEAMEDALKRATAISANSRWLTADTGANSARVIYRAFDFGMAAGSGTYVYKKYFDNDDTSPSTVENLELLKKELENTADGRKALEEARERLKKLRSPEPVSPPVSGGPVVDSAPSPSEES